MLRKKYILAAFSFLLICSLIFSSTKGFTATAFEKTTTDRYKPWTVHFNHEIDQNTITPSSIYMIGPDKKKVPITVQIANDLKSVTVIPSGPYQVNAHYQLFMKQEIKSKKSKPLKSETILNFFVEGTKALSNITVTLNPFVSNVSIQATPEVSDVTVKSNKNPETYMLLKENHVYKLGMLNLQAGDVLEFHALNSSGEIIDTITYTIQK